MLGCGTGEFSWWQWGYTQRKLNFVTYEVTENIY